MRFRLLLLGAVFGTLAWAADPFVATWKMRAPVAPLESNVLQITTPVPGIAITHRLSYRMTYAASQNIPPVTETFMTNLDGQESVAILASGTPTQVKMAVTRIDDRHWSAVVRTGGRVTSTSTVEISADGKVLKIATEARVNDGKTQSSTQFWDRQ